MTTAHSPPTRRPDPIERVHYPAMYQSWNHITFLHWRYDADRVQRLLPDQLAVETFDGSAWVGLTPFLLEDLHPPGLPAVPWLSRSPETNVRTYVKGPDGRPGIWFFSLDIARLPAVVVARTAYRLPYMWADLSFEERDGVIHYQGRRRRPASPRSYDITVEVDEPFEPDELRDLDHFLTARWVLFTFYGKVAASASAEHPPWPLRRARVGDLREDLIEAAGLSPPQGEPLVHFSRGVHVRISPPQLLGRKRRSATTETGAHHGDG